MKRLSVDQAIQRGQKMINYPIFALMIIGFTAMLSLPFLLDNLWFIPIGFITTFVVMWMWWSFRITKWRIWAFENCRNVHKLKKRAIEEKLIWPDGSRFEKTEIRNTEQRKKLEVLKDKFKIADEPEFIYDDDSIPNQTGIYYSKTSLAIYWFFGIGLLIYSFYLFTNKDSSSYILILVSIFLLYTAYKKSFLKNAPITLSSKGIKIQPNPLIKWEDIESVENKIHHSGSYLSWKLTLIFHKKDLNGNLGTSVGLNDFNISSEKLELLIKVYQQRNKNNL
jgi:hypothetical protein